MVTRMKTTIDVSDALLEAARQRARARGTTLRAVFEEGLRAVLAADDLPSGYELPDASFSGRGLRPEWRDADWSSVRAAIYEGQGE